MDLRDFQAFGEPGAMVYLADCVDLMKIMPPASVDTNFADPPYRLSNGGVTVKNGRQAPVDKGVWDRSMGFEAEHRFKEGWLREVRRILKPDGTIWVTGTHHIIFSLGFALQTMYFKLIKIFTWHRTENLHASKYRDLEKGTGFRDNSGILRDAFSGTMYCVPLLSVCEASRNCWFVPPPSPPSLFLLPSPNQR